MELANKFTHLSALCSIKPKYNHQQILDMYNTFCFITDLLTAVYCPVFSSYLKCIHQFHQIFRIADAAPFLVNIFLESQLASHTVRNTILLTGLLKHTHDLILTRIQIGNPIRIIVTHCILNCFALLFLRPPVCV